MPVVVDGHGDHWLLRESDTLEVHAEDQTFSDPKARWNRLVRTATPLFFANMYTHAAPVEDAKHIIQYTTGSGEHRTSEGSPSDTWLMLGNTPTLGFKYPSHLSTETHSSPAAWVPVELWDHRTSIPLGWLRPKPRSVTPLPLKPTVAPTPEPVVASTPLPLKPTAVPTSEPVVPEPVVASTPVAFEPDTPPEPVVAPIQPAEPRRGIMPLNEEEKTLLASLLATRQELQIIPDNKIAPGKPWQRLQPPQCDTKPKPKVDSVQPKMQVQNIGKEWERLQPPQCDKEPNPEDNGVQPKMQVQNIGKEWERLQPPQCGKKPKKNVPSKPWQPVSKLQRLLQCKTPPPPPPLAPAPACPNKKKVYFRF